MSDQGTKGIATLRARLADSHPRFAEADAFERELEHACMLIRGTLRAARKSLGIDQSSLAEKMQVGQPMISRIENGTGDIGMKTLYRYVNALGLALVVDVRTSADPTQTPSPGLTAAAFEEVLENVDRVRELLLAASEHPAAAE